MADGDRPVDRPTGRIFGGGNRDRNVSSANLRPKSFLEARMEAKSRAACKKGPTKRPAGLQMPMGGFKPAPVSPRVIDDRNPFSETAEQRDLVSLVAEMSDSELEAEPWQCCFDEQHSVDADGAVLRVYSAGSAEAEVTLLLLHGAGHSALSYARAAKELSECMRVVSYDARAHGYSTGLETDLSLQVMTDDARRVVKHISPRKVCAKSQPLRCRSHTQGNTAAPFSYMFRALWRAPNT